MIGCLLNFRTRDQTVAIAECMSLCFRITFIFSQHLTMDYTLNKVRKQEESSGVRSLSELAKQVAMKSVMKKIKEMKKIRNELDAREGEEKERYRRTVRNLYLEEHDRFIDSLAPWRYAESGAYEAYYIEAAITYNAIHIKGF